MLDWIAQMKRGVFEAESLEALKKQMIEHYAERNEDAGQIISLCGYDENGELLQQASEKELSEIQKEIEKGVTEWREEAQSNYQDRKQIEREVRSMRY